MTSRRKTAFDDLSSNPTIHHRWISGTPMCAYDSRKWHKKPFSDQKYLNLKFSKYRNHFPLPVFTVELIV